MKLAASIFLIISVGSLFACGDGEGRTCNVDCSNMFTGKIDVTSYGYTSRDECIEKGKSAGCTAKWCASSEDCEIVY